MEDIIKDNTETNITQSVEKFTDELSKAIQEAKDAGVLEGKAEDTIDLDFTKDTMHGDLKQMQAFFADYAKYSGEVGAPKKTKINPHFKAKYSPLEEVLATVKPILSKYNMAMIQIPSATNGMAGVKNILTHAGGFFMTFKEVECKSDKPTVQGLGSTWTYLKRYTLETITAVSSEDDDGEASEKKKAPAKKMTAEDLGKLNFTTLTSKLTILAKDKMKVDDATKKLVTDEIPKILGKGMSVKKSTESDKENLIKLYISLQEM
jgi:hypothetical protein